MLRIVACRLASARIRHLHNTPAIKLALSKVTKLEEDTFKPRPAKAHACSSCGEHLQHSSPLDRGFYIPPKVQTARLKLQDITALLNNSKHSLEVETSREKTVKPLVCKRCTDALNQNKFNPQEFQEEHASKILAQIPKDASVFHVVSAMDFPLSCRHDLFSKNHNVGVLVTKADMALPNKKSSVTTGVSYFSDIISKVWKQEDVKAVLVTSAVADWNVKRLYSLLGKTTYLVGAGSAGKSTLINSLLKHFDGYRMEKQNGQLVSVDTGKHKYAGVSHLKGFTRQAQYYRIGEKTVVDMPGYKTSAGEGQLSELLKPDWFLQLLKGTGPKPNAIASKNSYSSINGTENGKCYTLGGLFYLVPPAGTVNRIYKYMAGKDYVFRNIDKAMSVVADQENSPLSEYIGVYPEVSDKSKFVRYIIPPFRGKIDLVFKDIGYLEICPTGKHSTTECYELWAPPEIEVCVREPLSLYMNPYYIPQKREFMKTRDSKEMNLLKKKFGGVPTTRSIVSKLYPMAHDETNVLEKMKEMYIERTREDQIARKHMTTDPSKFFQKVENSLEKSNLYWYY